MSVYRRQLFQLRQRLDLSFEEFSDCSQSQVVIAGPGSGKTQCLLLKAAKLFEKEINPPQGLACLTFSRKLARELKVRLQDLWIVGSHPNLFVGTLHAFCLTSIVGPCAEKLDFPIPTQLRIASREERQQALDEAKRYTRVWVPTPDSEEFSFYRNSIYLDMKLDFSVDKDQYRADLHKLIQRYERNLLIEEPQKLDFDMLVRASLNLLTKEELVRKIIAARFPWILVDEYQDLGYPLHRLITVLTEQTSIKCFVVGDPLQCIYRFRGARPDYLQNLSENWPSIELKENYRSSHVISMASETVVENRHQRLLSPNTGYCHLIHCPSLNQNQVAAGIARELVQHQGIPADQITILAREKVRLLNISNMLDDIPNRLLRHPAYETYTLFVSWLELAATWCTIGWKKGIVDFEDILEDYINLYQCDQKVLSEEDAFKLRVDLYRTLSELRLPDQKLYDWLCELEDKLEMENLFVKLEEFLPDDLEHYRRIRTLINPGSSLQELTVDKFGVSIKRPGEVILNTVHGSKGDENSIVIVAGAEQLTNDPNLLYVAMTRAKFGLFVIYSGQESCFVRLVNRMEGKDGFGYEELVDYTSPNLNGDFLNSWEHYCRNQGFDIFYENEEV